MLKIFIILIKNNTFAYKSYIYIYINVYTNIFFLKYKLYKYTCNILI